MLSLFPTLLFYPLPAIALLRWVLAVYIGFVAYDRFKREYRYLSFIEFVSAVGIAIGAFTQMFLISSIVMMVCEYVVRRNTDSLYKFPLALLAVISLCLLFLGAGAFAVDLPL